MDYDSSTKFISSLAKFLQSLCNGYVEFDNGVEVIGHIYLSVDTGKKIDYILNEKVCKTDENSVTFISNSFHAQPAEKPKPNAKKGRSEPLEDKSVEDVEIVNDSSNQIELRNTNAGTVSRNSRNFHSSSPNLGKRPFSPHSKGVSKKSRTETQEPSLSESENGNSTADPLRGQNLSQTDSYEDNFPADSSFGVEDRDIKPSLDTDVTFVKEEFTSSSLQAEDDRSQGVDESFSSLYQNQSYSGDGGGDEGPPNQSFNQHNSRLSYGNAGERSDLYDTSMMSSQMEGNDGGTDPSVAQGESGKWQFSSSPSDRQFEPSCFQHNPFVKFHNRFSKHLNHVKTCKKCGIVFKTNLEMNSHKKSCTGKRHLTCHVCSKVLSRYDALAEHMRGIHGIGNKVACRFCGRGFKYKPQVYQHQATCPRRYSVPQAIRTQNPLLILSESLPSGDMKLSPSQFTSAANESPSPCDINLSPPVFPGVDVKPIISFPYDPQACP